MNKWQQITIGQFLTLQRGYDLTEDERELGNIPVFGAAGKNGFHNKALASAPGIVVGRCGGSFGQVYFANEDFWPHNTAMFVTDLKGNDPQFAYYLLKNLDFTKLNSGSAQPSLNRNYVYPIKITVPKPVQQQKIAAVLSALDAKIDCNNRINAELEAMAKTLYDYWFVQFDFPDANGKPYKSSGGRMVYNDALRRAIPAGWKVNSIGGFEPNIVTGKTPSTANPEYFNGSVPFVTIGDIRGNTYIIKTEQSLTFEGANTQKNKYLPENAICVSCIASPGLVGFVIEQAQTNQQINSIICENDYARYFLYFWIKGYFACAKAKTGNTFANMNKGDFSGIPIIEPNKHILEDFHNKMFPLFETIKAKSKENQQLTQLRDWLLPMLMNGQVTVS